MKQTTWVKKVDSSPNEGSENLITGGGVYTEVENLATGIAIMAEGNIHSAITSGQFVYVRGHGTLVDGMYKATANISTNGALSTSNLTAVPSGGLNALNAYIALLNSNIEDRFFYHNWRIYTTIEDAIKGEYANLYVGGHVLSVALSGGYYYSVLVVKPDTSNWPTYGLYFQYGTNKVKTFVYIASIESYSESDVVQPSDIPSPTSLEWTLVKKQQGKTEISLPSTAKEYLFVLSYGTATAEQALSFTFAVPNDASLPTKTLTTGYYLANGNCFGQVSFNAGRHTVVITALQVNGTEYADTSYLYAYYR